MFRTFLRTFFPNPLDWMLKRVASKNGKNILLLWNRGLGDIALGLYAITYRIRQIIPDAHITILTRSNLKDGFSMLEGVRIVTSPEWNRGMRIDVKQTFEKLGMNPKMFDLIIEKPNPTDWVRWQRGCLTPRLQWNEQHDTAWQKFSLSEEYTYIGVQAITETQYGLWRNWPLEHWQQLFARLEKMPKVKVLLLGQGDQPRIFASNVIDLRGKTNLFELLSIIKKYCRFVVLPDSGILSMVYYLDVSFPIHVISLWADPNHGILKQGVFSPNPQLKHTPLIGERRDLSSVSVQAVMNCLFPQKPLQRCTYAIENSQGDFSRSKERLGVILLAGGQGSRLGVTEPKGMFSVCQKSLFEWICEKVPPHMPIAVMTSLLNHAQTVQFFQQHQNFGRDVYFFSQQLQPVLDEKKHPTKMVAPDGNGSVFESFYASGMYSLFEEKGVSFVSIVPVDNPLANPADPALLSCLHTQQADVVIKCIERKEADHAMGVLVERAGRIEIVEYTELDSHTEYRYCYAGMMGVKLDFIKQIAFVPLPFHWVWKKIGRKFAWKGEKFLFDVLPYANNVHAVCYSRAQIYAPLKSKENIPYIEYILQNLQQVPAASHGVVGCCGAPD